MLTQKKFDKLPDYDIANNPEKLDLEKAKPVKALTVVDSSDTNIYYRDVDGVLEFVDRKIMKKRVGIGDVITFNDKLEPLGISGVVLAAAAKKASASSGQAARSGSNEKPVFSAR
jgi:hypothetical protein